jgi:hypothetical protein
MGVMVDRIEELCRSLCGVRAPVARRPASAFR